MEINNMLYPEKFAHGKTIKIYNNIQQMDSPFNCPMPHLSNDETTTLASYIHNNYNKMDENEMKSIVTKCMSSSDIKKVLLTFEFINYVDKPKKMSLDTFYEKAVSIINKYQSKVGGHLIEDEQWIVYKNGSLQELTSLPYYDIKNNQILLLNTIDKQDVNDYETDNYLCTLVTKLNNLATNISVKLRYKEKTKLTHILLWITDNDCKDENIVGF